MIELLTTLLVLQPLIYEQEFTSEEIQHVAIFPAEISGYSATERETDDNPQETASGIAPRDGIVACPGRYDFGTKVEILGRVYDCQDRMNIRYRDGDYFDIFFENTDDAWKFGRQHLTVSIITTAESANTSSR